MRHETPIACTLDGKSLMARLAAARELGAQALVGLNVSDRRALLRFRGARERVDALVSGERTCCASLELTTTADGDDTELEIVAPEGGEPLLRGLVAGIVAGWDTGVAQG